MRFYNICFLLVFFSISQNLYAEKYEYIGDCKINNHMEDFEYCLDKELLVYDKELNKLYRNFNDKNTDKKFKKIQLMWIKFKEVDCDYIAREVHEGLYYQFIYKVCLINKTKSRISDLKRSLFYSGWFEKKID